MQKTGGRLPRFRREAEAIRAINLTQRDREIIRQVARFKFLRSTQITALVEGGKAQILRRLQALYHHGWLDRPRCQIDYYHRNGSKPMAYCLGSRGLAFMRREHDLPFERMFWFRKGKEIGRLFLDHALMVSEVLVAVERACADSGGAVRFVSADNLIGPTKVKDPFRWIVRVRDREIGLVPDAVFALEFARASDPASKIVCCLEADRGTMPIERRSLHLSSLSRKFAAYGQAWKQGDFERRFKTRRIAVLTVTTSSARTLNIDRAVAALAQGRGLFTAWEHSALCADPATVLHALQPRP